MSEPIDGLTCPAQPMAPDASAQAEGAPFIRGSFGIVLPGVKRTSLIALPPGHDEAAFARHWIETHGRAIAAAPGVSQVVYNSVLKEHSYDLNVRSGSSDLDDKVKIPNPSVDAIIEILFETRSAFIAAYDDEQGLFRAEVRETPATLALVSRQIGIKQLDPGLPLPGIKRFGFIARPAGIPVDEFTLRWRDDHAPPGGLMPDLRKYHLNFTDRELCPDVLWDGYAECWWDSWDTYLAPGPHPVPMGRSNAERAVYHFMRPRAVD